jgi:hypothetical protein
LIEVHDRDLVESFFSTKAEVQPMSFRENLLKKIEINRLTDQIRKTVAPASSEVRLDKDLMRKLLTLSSFEPRQERDLNLYVKKTDRDNPLVLVLDNELPVYETSVEDVVIRKSPYTKEMLSLRNIVKILKDSDVKVSRKEDTLETVRADCLASLDLSYTPEDIESIAYDGAASLESKYPEGVMENLTLLAELAGFQTAPPLLKSKHHFVLGNLVPDDSGGVAFGPFFIYDRVHDRLGLVEAPVSTRDPEQVEFFKQLLDGQQNPPVREAKVFEYLKEFVLAGR